MPKENLVKEQEWLKTYVNNSTSEILIRIYMQNIDLSRAFLDMDGETVLVDTFEINGEKVKKNATVKRALINVLFTVRNQEMTPDDLSRAYDLGLKIRNAENIELSAEDVVFIKKQAAIIYSRAPMIYGQIIDSLEGKSQ